uniref:CID domain-containing protein n=1 Tax=Heterorhabditis bacteriophora TaxID=37862 RepID=A0A1I7W6D2_HETBA
MDTDVVKAFNAELSSIYDSRPPLSKKKIQDISKAALKAKSYYKHVVFSVEKFLAKCKTEYKIPCLYVIDSIIRSSKHQLKEKDVYAARFLKNFSKTLADLLSCPVTEQIWNNNNLIVIFPSLADVLIRDQNVINALKTMQQERILALNQVAAAAQAQQRAALAHPSGVNISLPPPSIPLSSGTLSQGLPSGLTSLPGLNLAQLTNLPVGSGSTQNSVTQAALLNMLAANPLVSNLLNQQSGSNIPFSPNRPPPTSMASIDSAQLAKQQELLKQLSAAAPLGVPPPGMGLLGAPPGQQLSQLPPQLQLHIEDVDMRGADADDRDPRGRKDRKRSRSKERGDHKRGRRSRFFCFCLVFLNCFLVLEIYVHFQSPQYEDPPQMDEKPLSTSPTDRLSSDKRNMNSLYYYVKLLFCIDARF